MTPLKYNPSPFSHGAPDAAVERICDRSAVIVQRIGRTSLVQFANLFEFVDETASFNILFNRVFHTRCEQLMST
jgi:hypothetical protein